MKIAVISDIHANKMALDCVLNDINKFNPDKIFCLGDIILAGYDPNGVCEEVMKLQDKYRDDFIIIQGNTDKMVANCTPQLIEKTKEAFPCMGYSLEEDVKITKKEYIDFVKNLPLNKTITLNNITIELVHGSPRRQDENIFPNLDPCDVEKMVENSPADLILCGHTHIPCGYSLNSGKTVINAGSLGRSMMPDCKPVYLQLTIDKYGKFYSEHIKLEYDNKMVANHILMRGFKYCEDLAKMYIPR